MIAVGKYILCTSTDLVHFKHTHSIPVGMGRGNYVIKSEGGKDR